MDQLTVRGVSVAFPRFPEEFVLDIVPSLGPACSMVSHFNFRSVSIRALDMKDAKLMDGKINSVRAETSSMVGVNARRVEFSNCELSSLRWSGGKIVQTQFNSCKLLGAKFDNVSMENVVFTDCKMDYATFNRVRTSGPVMFVRCSLREAEFSGCDMTRALLDECNLMLANFQNGRYADCDLRGNDLSALRGVCHLRRVVIDPAQLAQISSALAAELEINFGDDN